MSMKKRKLKKKFKILLVLILIIITMVIFLINQKPKVEPKKEEIKKEEVKKVEDSKKEMSLIAVGDVLIHDSVYKDAKTSNSYDFSSMFELIKPILKKYDLKYCNQESPIAGLELGISGYPSFNSPKEIGDELVDNLGFNLISLANNHLFDKGKTGAINSVNYWKEKKANVAGSYGSFEERDNIPVYEANGIKYAFLSYTTFSNNQVASGYEYLLNIYSDEKVKNDIEKIKDKTDVIIVSMHWGEEDLTNKPIESQRRIANYLSSLGVNLILGSHAHTIQPIEYINDTLVVYGLGNFISNQLVLTMNNAIGLMVGMDIVVEDDKVTFNNIYKELLLSYSESSTNFKVIPLSNLTDNDLSKCGNNCKNYTASSLKEEYMKKLGG